MQEALDALTYVGDKDIYSGTIDALRARLAQPEQKPVVWRYRGNLHEFDPSDWASGEVTPLYTAPQQREWVGLTDEDYEAMAENHVTNCYFDTLKYARAIEAKLKEKNSG